jgi:hypothetical protein
MNKLHITIIIYIAIIIAAVTALSCNRYDETDLQLPEHAMVGEWKVDAFIGDLVIYKDIVLQANEISSSRNDSISLKDSENYFWDFQVRVAADVENASFDTQKSISEVGDHKVGVKISNGKVIDNDSIYFEIAFEDDEIPYGTTYRLKGSRIIE